MAEEPPYSPIVATYGCPGITRPVRSDDCSYSAPLALSMLARFYASKINVICVAITLCTRNHKTLDYTFNALSYTTLRHLQEPSNNWRVFLFPAALAPATLAPPPIIVCSVLVPAGLGWLSSCITLLTVSYIPNIINSYGCVLV